MHTTQQELETELPVVVVKVSENKLETLNNNNNYRLNQEKESPKMDAVETDIKPVNSNELNNSINNNANDAGETQNKPVVQKSPLKQQQGQNQQGVSYK
jgi:hypothetical protein